MKIEVGFFHLITIVLIILKLCHVISLSWVWVTIPSWGTILFGLACVGILKIIKIWG